MQVSSIMTKQVVGVPPTATIAEAANLMIAHRISGLPVIDADNRLVGIVSEGDFVRRSELGTERKRAWWLEFLLSPGKAADEYTRANGRRVSEIMATDIASVSPDDPVDKAVRVMTSRHVKRLPVVTGDTLVGILTRSDLLRATLGVLSKESAATPEGDAAIRSAILAEIARQPWGGGKTIDVTVKDGVVEMSGSIFDERERSAARVAAENVPGVKEVKEGLILIDPISGTTF